MTRLDELLLGAEETRWVVVSGGPGMGKSAILSEWLARREAAGSRLPHHFIRRQVADWDQPEVIAGSLGTQIEMMFPDLRDPDAKPERRVMELLGRLSKQLGSSGRLVIVIDGLDESRADPGDNPLPRFLPPVVPKGIRFLCATRPTYPHLNWFDAQSSVRRVDLDGPRWAPSNEGVVRAFWDVVSTSYQPPLSNETKAAAIARAEGNVLHAIMLNDALCDLPPAERRGDRIPRGFAALIGEIWERAAAYAEVRAGLGLLCAAQEALSLDVLADLAGWSFHEKERFGREGRQLLLEQPGAWAGAEGYRLRYDWVREFVAERLGAATLIEHHRTLARRLATWPPPSEPTQRMYALRHSLTHRIAVDDWPGVRALASNLGYLETCMQAVDVFAMEQGLADAARRCPDPATARDLSDLARALARESHWVRDDANGTAGLIWNRLRRSGWTVKNLEARISLPDSAAFLRARHAVSRESAALERSFEGHTARVTACALVPDGRRVLSASDDRTLKLWDLDGGRAIATFHGHDDVVTACTVTRDGTRAVSASVDRTLKIWDLSTGGAVATLEGHTAPVNACAAMPDGERVVSGAADGTVRIWSLRDGRALSELEGHARGVTACAVLPDGRIVTASADHSLKIWRLEPAQVVVLEGHTGWVNTCAAMPDGRRIISGSDDGTLRIWDANTGTQLSKFDNHSEGVTSCAPMGDGRRVVCAFHNGMLKVIDLGDSAAAMTLRGHAGVVSGCAMTPDARRVVSASFDGTLKVWDLLARRVLGAFDGHDDLVSACAVTPDGRRAISASHDNLLKVWDIRSGRVQSTLQGHQDWVNACAVMPDGRRAISASHDATLKVWDLDSGQELATLKGDHLPVHACVAMPDNRRVVSASHDGSLAIWDVDKAEVVYRIDVDVGMVRAVTPDGTSVIANSRDGALKIHDLRSGAVHKLEGHADAVTACAVTSDSARAVSGLRDGTLVVHELSTRTVRAVLRGHARQVNACAITPDDCYVISASADRTLKVWDLASSRCLYTHRGDAAFECVTAIAAGIIAGDHVGTVWFLAGQRDVLPRSSRPRTINPSSNETASSSRRGRR